MNDSIQRDDYMQHMWRAHAQQAASGKGMRVFAWIAGAIVAAIAAAAVTQPYWYPYLETYF